MEEEGWFAVDNNLIRLIATEIIQDKILMNWYFWFLVVALWFVSTSASAYIISYFKIRGQNRAMDLVIEKMTKTVEGIKLDFAKQLEALKQENKLLFQREEHKFELSSAVMEKRLQAHQEAHTLWLDLFHSIHNSEELWDMVIKCQDWYKKNSLYLDSETANEFSGAYMAASIHKDLLEGPRDAEAVEEIRENFERIRKAGDALREAASLKSWKDFQKDIEEKETSEDESKPNGGE